MPSNYLSPSQSRQHPLTPYETKLAGAIEEIFGAGAHDLPALLAGLNGNGLTAPDGQPWTEENFAAEMHRLGA